MELKWVIIAVVAAALPSVVLSIFLLVEVNRIYELLVHVRLEVDGRMTALLQRTATASRLQGAVDESERAKHDPRNKGYRGDP